MEFSESIEFVKVKDPHDSSNLLSVVVRYQIELKHFNRFKAPFITDKYLTITQWEEIMSHIKKLSVKKIKSGSDETKNEGSVNIDDDSLQLCYAFVPKKSSFIDFRKLKPENTLQWMMNVRIRSTISDFGSTKQEKQQKVSSAVEDPSEYCPVSETVPNESRYTASTKSSLDNPKQTKTNPEYSPRSTNNFRTNSLRSYTPSKIKNKDSQNSETPGKTNHNQMKDLFGNSSSEDNETVSNTRRNGNPQEPIEISSNSELSIQKRIKRQLLPVSEKKDKKGAARQHKKIKSNEQTTDVWVSTNPPEEASTNITTRKKLEMANAQPMSARKARKAKADLDPLEIMTHENLERMEQFLEKSKQDEINKNRRRLELQDYVVWDCCDVSNEELKCMVKDFAPIIRSSFSNVQRSARIKTFDPVLLVTSNILSERQLSFVCSEIENVREVSDRGYNEDILHDVVLPQFIQHVFQKTFHLSSEEAIERIKTQEEFRSLFQTEDLLL